MLHTLFSRMPRSWTDGLAKASRHSKLLGRLRAGVVRSLKGRDSVVVSGVGKGLLFNPRESDSRFVLGTFEPAVQEFLASYLKPGMVVYDIGANVGFLSMIAARLVGSTGAVHCFEPLPLNVESIGYNAALNHFSNVIVHAVALADRDGTADFRVSERPTFGALDDAPMEVDRESGVIQVAVRRGDSFFSEKQLPAPAVIKMDIEGSEIAFLAGAQEMIRRNRPVLMIELHGTNDPVSEWFDKLEYKSAVVGGGTIKNAPWAAIAIGVPRENDSVFRIATDVCGRFESR